MVIFLQGRESYCLELGSYFLLVTVFDEFGNLPSTESMMEGLNPKPKFFAVQQHILKTV
jgi:hypothetical protein